MSRGLFSGVGEAKANFGANYEREGHYYMFIRRIKRDCTRKGVEFVAVEKVCLKVINSEGIPEAHRVGEHLSHLLMSDKDSFLGNIKAMISSIMGVSPDMVDEEACELVVSDDQPLSCRVVEMQNKLIRTRPKPNAPQGTPFTLISYKRTLTPDEIIASIPVEDLEQHLSKQELMTLLEGATISDSDGDDSP